jgi:hypothetical protein
MEHLDHQYESLVSWYYIEEWSNYPGPKGRVVPDAEGYDNPSKYEGTELYIPKGAKGYKEYAGNTSYFTDYEGNSAPFKKEYFKLNPNITNEILRMQVLAGVITESEYKAKLEEQKKPKSKKSLKENFVGFGAINNPFLEREKTDYEMAFDHYVNKNPIKEEETPVSEDVNDNPTDEIKLDVPLLIRLLEYAREDAKTDMDLHNVAERLIDLSRGGECLGMVDYEAIVGGFESGTEEMEETEI